MPFTFAQLRTESPEYKGRLWQELGDLYRGGYALQARLTDYLPRLTNEREERYRDRCSGVAYINYFGQICDYFTSALFAQELTITQASDADDPTTPGGPADQNYYAVFAHNADLKGSSLSTVLRGAFNSALVKRRAILCVDMPRNAQVDQIVTRADEEELGAARAYVYELPVEQLIDWEYDEFGKFAWAIIYRQRVHRASPEDARNAIVHEFKVWRVNDAGLAAWEIYRLAKAVGEEVKAEDPVPLVDSGTTTFQQIPIVELTVPDGLWVGNKIGPLAKEHLQRRSALISAENKSLVSIPVAYLGSEVGSDTGDVPGEVQQNPSRGRDPVSQMQARGFMVLGKDDRLAFEEPVGRAYELTDRQLSELKTEMFRIVERMAASVDNSSSSTRRSGASKKQDRAPENIVLGAMGARVRDAALRVFNMIAASRGESVVWTTHGLDEYDSTDRQELITEAQAMTAIDIPSPTFWKAYKTQTALKLATNLPPDTQDVVRAEIEAGVDEADAAKKKQADQTMHALMGALGAGGVTKKPQGKPLNPAEPDDEDADADDKEGAGD